MNRTEFVEKYNNIVGQALQSTIKARNEGLLALEDALDQEKVNARDIFEYGARNARISEEGFGTNAGYARSDYAIGDCV